MDTEIAHRAGNTAPTALIQQYKEMTRGPRKIRLFVAQRTRSARRRDGGRTTDLDRTDESGTVRTDTRCTARGAVRTDESGTTHSAASGATEFTDGNSDKTVFEFAVLYGNIML
jgi:hypothetical protein